MINILLYSDAATGLNEYSVDYWYFFSKIDNMNDNTPKSYV